MASAFQWMPRSKEVVLKRMGSPHFADDDYRFIWALELLAEVGTSRRGLAGIKEEYDFEIPQALAALHRKGIYTRDLFTIECYAADFAGGTGSAEVKVLWSAGKYCGIVYWRDAEGGDCDVPLAFEFSGKFLLSGDMVHRVFDHCVKQWGWRPSVSRFVNYVPSFCGWEQYKEAMLKIAPPDNDGTEALVNYLRRLYTGRSELPKKR